MIEESRVVSKNYFEEEDRIPSSCLEEPESLISAFEVAVEEGRFSAIDTLEDLEPSFALKTFYQRIDVKKDLLFKQQRERYLHWRAYRPLLFVWQTKKDLFRDIPAPLIKEIMKYC